MTTRRLSNERLAEIQYLAIAGEPSVDQLSAALIEVLSEVDAHRAKDAQFYRLAQAIEPEKEGTRQVLHGVILDKCGPRCD